MKRILTTLLAVILIISQVALATGAVIADPLDGEIVTTIRSASDEPDLVVNGENPWVSKVFKTTDVKPGDSGAASLELENIGPGGTGELLQLHILNLVDDPAVTVESEPTPDLGELSQNLDMLIWFDDGDSVFEWGEVIIAQDTLYNIACTIYDLGPLPPGVIIYIGIAWSLDCGVGNEAQYDICTFDIQLILH